MTRNNTVLAIGVVAAVAVVGYFLYSGGYLRGSVPQDIDPTPRDATLSGAYVCLPHLDTAGPQTTECAFGLKTDDGIYYAVNFGASAQAMEQFQSGVHITAQGNVVPKEALSSDHWANYNMKGIFTITKIIEPAPAQGKIDINAVCEGAVSYMTFPDAASAETFVAECKEGKHPEVIEHYKTQMGLGDGAAI
jgi:hypothetical protein